MSSSIVDALGRIPLSANLMATLTRAAGYAGAQQHREVALEHLLLALTEDPDAALVLTISRVEIETLKGDISSHIGRMDDRVTQSPVTDLRIANELKDILAAAAAAAEGRRNEIDGAIVLAAIVGDGRSASAHLLRAHGLTFETAIRALQQAATVGQPPNPAPGAPQPQSQPQNGAQTQPAAQQAAEPPAQTRAAAQRPVTHHNPTSAEDILASARQRVQGRIAPGLPDARAFESAETERADTLAAAEAATDAEFERIAAEASHSGEPATKSHDATLDAELPPSEPSTHSAEPRPAPPAQRPMPPGALRPSGPPRPSPQAPGTSTAAQPHAGQHLEPRRAPQPALAPFPSADAAAAMPPPQNAPQTGRTTQPAPPARFERANATAPSPVQPHPAAQPTGAHTPPAATSDERTGGRGSGSDRTSEHVPGYAASPRPPMAPPMPGAGSPYSPAPHVPQPPHGATTAGTPPAAGHPTSAQPSPPPMRGPLPSSMPAPLNGQPPAGVAGQRIPHAPVPQGGPAPPQRPGPPPMPPPGYRPPDAHPGTFAGPPQPVPPTQGRAPAMAPPGAPPTPEPQRRVVPPPGGQGTPVSVSIGQLVENIPRVMRVAVASLVEVRVARADVKAVSDGMQGGGPAHRHEVKVTKAMSVRLRAPDGGFFIESSSPETQWIDNAHMLSDDYASWRWTVTPKERGSRRLQLVISARTVASDGLAAETSLPDQIVEVRVKTNYAKAMVRTGGWAVAAIAGGLLAKFGEGLPRAAWELTKVFVKQ
ncbi:MAG: hypothetical protein JNM89_05695 [Hyphomicrobiaceae bacterium]|nr:hypothetical protein [Hyphomicrobiaceae bacterium]